MDSSSRRDEGTDVVEVRVRADSSASATDVLAAASDFSERRIRIWPNVSARRYEVHVEGDGFAEVTEAALQGFFWERSRYEWSPGGPVRQTVIESNGLLPGSSWELTATPAAEGSRVEVLFRRRFKRTPKGRIARVVNRHAGNLLYGSDLRRAIAKIESEGSSGHSP